MEHTCPRCRKLFDCRANQIGVCPCVKVTLTPEQQRFIQSQYVGCLCPACLTALGATTGPVFAQST